MRLKKGMQALLSAVEETPEMELLLIGGVRKDERHAFEHWQARSTAAAARVHEVPYERDRGHLRALYNACELMVFPSLWEGMPNGVLEAMACARPVLASAVGGVLDLIEDGKTGWLLPPDRLPELAPRIRELLSRSSAERDAIGQAARAQVMTHHRPQQEVERILEVYRGLLRAD
jgi:glycosyltransferase involved in cell wall biosynthesis